MQNNGFIKYGKTDCSCIHVVDIFYNDYLEQVLGNGCVIFWLKHQKYTTFMRNFRKITVNFHFYMYLPAQCYSEISNSYGF